MFEKKYAVIENNSDTELPTANGDSDDESFWKFWRDLEKPSVYKSWRPEDFQIIDSDDKIRITCEFCGHKYFADLMERHYIYCREVRERKEMIKHKTEILSYSDPKREQYLECVKRCQKKSRNWRKCHEDFVFQIKRTRQVIHCRETNEPIPAIFLKPDPIPENHLTCNNCGRSFDMHILKRHMEVCKKTTRLRRIEKSNMNSQLDRLKSKAQKEVSDNSKTNSEIETISVSRKFENELAKYYPNFTPSKFKTISNQKLNTLERNKQSSTESEIWKQFSKDDEISLADVESIKTNDIDINFQPMESSPKIIKHKKPKEPLKKPTEILEEKLNTEIETKNDIDELCQRLLKMKSAMLNAQKTEAKAKFKEPETSPSHPCSVQSEKNENPPTANPENVIKFCFDCGEDLAEHSNEILKFCPSCGVSLN